MKNFKKLLLVYLCVYSCSAQIFEIKKIKDIHHYHNGENNILFVFDIDNTLAEATVGEGGSQWFDGALDYLSKKGLNKQETYNKVIPIYISLNKKNGIRLIENDTAQVISELQKKYPVIALTARSKKIISTTIAQLKSLGIDFSRSTLAQKNIVFENFPYYATFKKGIIFCGDNNKGKVLKNFLKQTQLTPSKIIFTDDKKNCLANVEKSLKNKTPFTGLRYGFLDEKVQNFRFHPSMLK
jgi:hypothetical protein